MKGTTIVPIMCSVMFVLLVGLGLYLRDKSRAKEIPPKATPVEHVHKWGSWSKPEQLWTGFKPQWMQTRICTNNNCGFAEMRVCTVE